MADAQVVIDLLARDRASAAIHKVGEAAGHTASRTEGLSKVFGKLGGLIGGEVGEALNKVSDAFDQVGEHQKGLASKMLGAGGVVTALGAFLQTMGSKDKAAMNQFDAAVAATGKGFSGLHDQVEKTIKQQENYGHTAPDTIEALRKLTQATGDPKKALAQMSLTANLAAAQHVKLSDAADQLAKVLNGRGTRMLAAYGITAVKTAVTLTTLDSAQKAQKSAVVSLAKAHQALIDKEALLHGKRKVTLADEISLRNLHDALSKAQANLSDKTKTLHDDQQALNNPLQANKTVIDQLSGKLKGQAAAAVDTFSGHMDVLKTKVEDAVASFGEKFGGALTAAGPIMMTAGAAMQILAARQASAAAATDAESASAGRGVIALTAQKAATVASAVASKAMAAAQWLLNAALDANPIGLVVIALAALAAGLFYAYNHSKTFREIVQGAFQAVGAAGSALWNDVLKPVFKFIADAFLALAGAIIHGAADAFGWVPGIGPKLKAAAKAFDKFRDDVNASLNGIKDKTVSVNVVRQQQNTNVTHKNAVPAMAKGGIVTKPTIALVGEAGPEAIIPLKGASMDAPLPLRLKSAPNAPSILIQVSGALDARGVAQQIEVILTKLRRERGTNLGFV